MKFDLFYSDYLRCPSCGIIINDSSRSLSQLSKPAPCCGAYGSPREIWPSLSVSMFFEIVLQQDNSTEEGLRVSIIFLSTALEVLLEDALWQLFELHTNSLTIAETLFESNNGRDRRLKLYNSLSDTKFSKLLDFPNGIQFIDRWAKLTKMRNLLVHGKYFIDKAEAKTIVEFIRDSALEIFVKVENDIKRQATLKSV